MQMIYENRYEVNRQSMLDWSRHPLDAKTKRIRKGFVIVWMVCGAFFALNAVASIMNELGLYGLFYVLIGLFCFYRALFRNRMLVKKQFKALSAAQGTDSWERVIRLDDRITVKDGSSVTEYRYSQVTDIVGDSDYIALMIGDNLGIRMERGGFTMGNGDKLAEFIHHQKFIHRGRTVRETVVIGEEEYEFATGIRDDQALRKSFFALARKTFGLDFEPWYQGGWWRSAYQPHVLIKDGRVVANVSANTMIVAVDGQERHYIQLGTVMTSEEYRGRGLSRYLMDRVLEAYQSGSSLVYLFANDTVLNYYPRFGFEKRPVYTYHRAFEGGGERTAKAARLNMEVESDRNLLIHMAAQTVNHSKLHVAKETGLLMFYCSGFMKDMVYYSKEMDAVLIGEQQENSFYLYDVFAKSPVDLVAAARTVAADTSERLILGFAPANEQGWLAEEDTQEQLFVLGEDGLLFEEHKLLFPAVSVA